MVLVVSLALGSILAFSALAAVGVAWARRTRDELDEFRERLAALESRLGPPSPDPRPTRPVVKIATRRADGPEEPPGPTLIAVPDLAAEPCLEASEATAAAFGRRYAALWALADAGASAASIARETGQPVGQVELILGLRRTSPATAGEGSDPE
jgi:hypothetical protein